MMVINVKSLLIMAVVAIIAISCATRMGKGKATLNNALTAYSNVNVDEFQNLIAENSVQLLDVRTPEEFAEGHIAGATLVDVNDSTFTEQAMAVLDATRPVAVYCRSGRRSARAASLLSAKGMKVTNLNGGVIAWQDAGKTLVK